jgi:hypothetical protein
LSARGGGIAVILHPIRLSPSDMAMNDEVGWGYLGCEGLCTATSNPQSGRIRASEEFYQTLLILVCGRPVATIPACFKGVVLRSAWMIDRIERDRRRYQRHFTTRVCWRRGRVNSIIHHKLITYRYILCVPLQHSSLHDHPRMQLPAYQDTSCRPPPQIVA